MSQSVMQNIWFAIFKVRVISRAHMIKIWQFLVYLLNCWSFCYQIWFYITTCTLKALHVYSFFWLQHAGVLDTKTATCWQVRYPLWWRTWLCHVMCNKSTAKWKQLWAVWASTTSPTGNIWSNLCTTKNCNICYCYGLNVLPWGLASHHCYHSAAIV